jgi:hypothetical protein
MSKYQEENVCLSNSKTPGKTNGGRERWEMEQVGKCCLWCCSFSSRLAHSPQQPEDHVPPLLKSRPGLWDPLFSRLSPSEFPVPASLTNWAPASLSSFRFQKLCFPSCSEGTHSAPHAWNSPSNLANSCSPVRVFSQRGQLWALSTPWKKHFSVLFFQSPLRFF